MSLSIASISSLNNSSSTGELCSLILLYLQEIFRLSIVGSNKIVEKEIYIIKIHSIYVCANTTDQLIMRLRLYTLSKKN